jgi:hypothetical protein
MFKLFGVVLCCLGLVISTGTKADSCVGPGSANARILNFSISDEGVRTALAAALHLGLNPYNFPQDWIARIATPCKRLDFKGGDGLYTLYGVDARDTPPRYAIRPSDRSRIAYLALLPLPKPALAAMSVGSVDGRFHFKPPDMMYVLAITDGYQRPFFRFYDTIPDDHTLAIDMCAALTGEDMPIGVYNSSFGNTQFYTAASPKPTPHPRCRVTVS